MSDHSKGQTLIEVVAALGVAVVVVTLITISVIYALNNALSSKNQNTATQYAQEAMELVRTIRDSDLVAFNELSGNYCLAKGAATPTLKQGDCGQNVDIFKREITITTAGCDDGKKVQAIVSWSDGKCTAGDLFCHEVNLVSCLSHDSAFPTP